MYDVHPSVSCTAAIAFVTQKHGGFVGSDFAQIRKYTIEDVTAAPF